MYNQLIINDAREEIAEREVCAGPEEALRNARIDLGTSTYGKQCWVSYWLLLNERSNMLR